MRRRTEPMTLDQILEYLIQASKDLRKQVGDEEYARVMSFDRAIKLMRTPVGGLPTNARA